VLKSTNSGLEHVDQDYLTANNITFFSAQGCNSMAVAEFIISAIVNLADEILLSLIELDWNIYQLICFN
jgi:erythronate-4-phosphate dehydrogenase